MKIANIEVKVVPCVVSGPKGEPIALVVASSGADVKRFPARETHLPCVYNALFIGLGNEGYMVSCYKELLRQS